MKPITTRVAALLFAVVSLFTFTTAASAQPVQQTITIGVSIPTLDNPFWVRSVDFAEHVAKQLGATLVVVDAQNREEKQISDVQSLISRGVQALVVVPYTTASAAGLIRIANRANVPIMLADRHPGFPADNPDAPYLAFIGPDDAQAGRQIANALMDKGVKKMVAIGGLPGSSMAEGRKRGLDEAVAQRPDVTLVQYFGTTEVSEEGGYRIMQNLLAAHPKGTIDGLWCYNDGTCLGAFRAVRQARRSNEISIAAMDLVPQALDLIAQNSNYIYSTGGHWLQIGFGVLIAFDKVNGHAPLQTHIGLDLLGVNSASFAKFRQQFIDNNPPYDVKAYSLTFNPKATQQTFPLRIKE